MKDGSKRQHELRYQKGHHGNPMSEDEVKGKFKSLFAEYGDKDQAETIISIVDNLENSKDIRELIDVLAKR